MAPGMTTPLMLALPRGVRVASFADGCRTATLDFVNRVSVRPDKAALADWLAGAYRTHVVSLGASTTRRLDAAAVLPGALERVLSRTRQAVLRELERAKDPIEGVAFGYSALAAGFLYRCRDAEGREGWIPVGLPRMRLVDRVLSLVAADQLLRCEDYETALFTCSRCGSLVFDAERAEGRVCERHASDVRELLAVPSRRAIAG